MGEMKNFLVLLLLVLFTGCSQESLPEEDEYVKDIGDGTESVITSPHDLKYDLTDMRLFVDAPATPNKLSFKGEKESINFIAIPALPTGLSIDPETGNIIGTPTQLKTKSTYTIRVQNEHGFETTLINIEIVIPPPKNLTYSTADLTIINGVTPVALNPVVEGITDSFSISPALPSGLSFNTQTGAITGISSSIRVRTPYTVRANNTTGYAQYTFFLTVIDIAPENLAYDVVEASYMVNQVITPNNPSFSGGVPSSYIIEPVTLPAGLSFNVITGVISGVPKSEVPNFLQYRITAVNSGGSAITNIKIKVEDVAPRIPKYKNPIAYYTKDSEITPNILECAGSDFTFENCTDGGKPTLVQISPALPNGLSYNSYTGVITGTPTELSSLTDYVITTSNTGGTRTGVVSIGVNDRAPQNLRYRKNSFEIRKDQAFSLPSPFNDGGPVTSYEIISGSLPSGLSFNTSTGEVTGTPTVVTGTPITIAVRGTNSGGSNNFSFSLNVLPVPYYLFNYKLIGKTQDNGLIKYSFEIVNESREYNDSRGISLAMPINVESTHPDVGFISNPDVSTCFSYNNEENPFEYQETCNITITFPNLLNTPVNEVTVNLKASNVFTRTFDLRNFMDITPKDVELISERGTIVKVFTDMIPYPVNRNSIASFASTSPIVNLLMTSSIGLPSQQQNAQSAFSYDLLTAGLDLVEFKEDPDNDGDDANHLFNNLDFINRITLSANIGNYNPTCVIEIPYSPLAECELGDFNIESYDINESGKFKVKLTLEEGLPSEVGESNEISVDVYQIKRVINTELPPRRIIPYNNKVYFAGLMDPTTTNSRKLLSYNPNTKQVRQVSEFLSNGDDRPFPFAEHDGWLFFKGREPGTNYIKFYVYDENLDKISPLYTQTQIEAVDREDVLPTFKFQDKLFFPLEEKSSGNRFWTYYDKLGNNFAKMFNPFTVSTNPLNGVVDEDGFVAYNNKLFFYSYIDTGNNQGGYKLQSIDYAKNGIAGQMEHRWVSNIYPNYSDYLTNGVVYDNKIFYLAKQPGTPIQSSLLYYDEVSNPQTVNGTTVGEFVSILSASGTGEGYILGVAYGKLFFSLPGTDRDEVYYYDGSSRTISKIYSAKLAGNKIKKIDRFSNIENKQIVYFMEESLQGNHLMVIEQELADIAVKHIVDGRYLYLTKDLSMFNFNNTLFFSCDNSLESLCSYNSSTETVSKVADGVNLKIHTLPMGAKSGIILMNNKIYFGSDKTSTGQKSGVFELCIKGSSGCLSN